MDSIKDLIERIMEPSLDRGEEKAVPEIRYAEGRYSKDPMYFMPELASSARDFQDYPGVAKGKGVLLGRYVSNKERKDPGLMRKYTIIEMLKNHPQGDDLTNSYLDLGRNIRKDRPGNGAILVRAPEGAELARPEISLHEQGHSLADSFVDQLAEKAGRFGVNQRTARELPGFAMEGGDKIGLDKIFDAIVPELEQTPEVKKYISVRERLKKSKPNYDVLR